MKKNLLWSLVVLVATTLFTACNPDNQGSNALKGLEVKPSSITLSTGQTVRLAALTTPENLTVDIEWATSNPGVATVSELGIVTAVGLGSATITATSGEFSGSCRVTVQSYLETLQFTQSIIWNYEILDSTDIKVIKANDGTEYKCYLAETTNRLFSAGIYIDNEGYFAGASEGAIIDVIAPMYYAPKELNNADRNTVFSLGEWLIQPSTEREHLIAQPGAITDVYLPSLLSFVDKFNAGDEGWVQDVLTVVNNGYTGTALFCMYYGCDDTSCGYGYANEWGVKLPNAIVTKGQLYADGVAQGSSNLMTVLNYSSLTLRELAGTWGGLDAEFDEENGLLNLNSNNLLLSDEFTLEQGTLPAEVKGSMMAVPFVMVKDYPEIAKRIDEELAKKSFTHLRVNL
ncbi:MAG: Ig-like domain-containing protein [Paludibacter sp.]|nr:Ig-like domain-containing protein [Bacteroidales bacterium]MCM1069788.1 Ig-like domain-containing protein [Prevotella sp.]MCM1354510.1 Ig-like domain-containing protein [Bacteroides sp.]MCM1443313.1 Ig-like domain-containing protein [Muribaculum sp.]MCM1482437.1 Ig-like domain-containing protein [Paludibacter sp.]